MKWVKTQRGVTLVELVVVLAITGLLVAGVLANQARLRQNTAFTAAIDIAANQIKTAQNEATQGVADRQTQTALKGKSGAVVFGKMVEFDKDANGSHDSRRMRTWTLIGDAANPSARLQKCDGQDVAFQQGVHYKGKDSANAQAIVFANGANGSPTRVYAIDPFSDTSPVACTTGLGSSGSFGGVGSDGGLGNSGGSDVNHACPAGYAWNGSSCQPIPTTIVNPLDGQTVSTSPVTVTVTMAPGKCVSINLKGNGAGYLYAGGSFDQTRTVCAASNGQASTTYVLQTESSYTAKVTRTDATTCGTVCTATPVTFTYKIPIPTVITSPTNGASIASATTDVKVTGEAGKCATVAATAGQGTAQNGTTQTSTSSCFAADGKATFKNISLFAGSGTYTLTANRTDVATCGSSCNSAPVTITRSIATPPPVVSATSSDLVTSDWNPCIPGQFTWACVNTTITGLPNATVAFTVNNYQDGTTGQYTTTLDGNGRGSFSLPTRSVDIWDSYFDEAAVSAHFRFTATQTDANGRTSAASNAVLGHSWIHWYCGYSVGFFCYYYADWTHIVIDNLNGVVPAQPPIAKTKSHLPASLRLSMLVSRWTDRLHLAALSAIPPARADSSATDCTSSTNSTCCFGSTDPYCPANYATGSFSGTVDIPLETEGDTSKQAVIHVDPTANTVDRKVVSQ